MITSGDLDLSLDQDYVATVVIRRPPDNYLDFGLIAALADAYAALDEDPRCRAIVLCSEGKHFCAGANFGRDDHLGGDQNSQGGAAQIYAQAARLMASHTPVVAAIQGAAIGGGLGLACTADFRVASPAARFSANFARLGFHHGFGLSETLPAIIGPQRALLLLLTGRRIDGNTAHRLGLCDELVPAEELPETARRLAAEIASCAPLAIQSIRETMRADLASRFAAAVSREAAEQDRLKLTADFATGVRAVAERKLARFEGR